MQFEIGLKLGNTFLPSLNELTIFVVFLNRLVLPQRKSYFKPHKTEPFKYQLLLSEDI